jgi:hypothetical protein
MLFAVENLAPSVQAANLNETEEAALFNLLLWDTGAKSFEPINNFRFFVKVYQKIGWSHSS